MTEPMTDDRAAILARAEQALEDARPCDTFTPMAPCPRECGVCGCQFIDHALRDLLGLVRSQEEQLLKATKYRVAFMDSKFWESKARDYQRRAEVAEALLKGQA